MLLFHKKIYFLSRYICTYVHICTYLYSTYIAHYIYIVLTYKIKNLYLTELLGVARKLFKIDIYNITKATYPWSSVKSSWRLSSIAKN